MTEHLITIDELDETNGADWAYAAFCTDECGFAGDWHHADNQDGYDASDVDTFDQARADAYAQAEADGDEHFAEHGFREIDNHGGLTKTPREDSP